MAINLEVEILGEFRSLSKATKGSEKALKGLERSAQSVSRSINAAFATIGLGLSLRELSQGIKLVTKAASDDRKAQALLATQLRNSTDATEEQIAAVEDDINALSNLTGVLDDDLRPAMSTLVRSTGDITTSTELLTLALDISAATGKDLNSVALVLAKAYNGNTTSLRKLIPALKEGEDWQKQLKEQFEGSAEAAGNLDPYTKLTVIFENLKEQIGTAFLPILERFAQWFVDNQDKVIEFTDKAVAYLDEKLNQATVRIPEYLDKVKEFFGYIQEIASGEVSSGNPLAPLADGINQVVAVAQNLIRFFKGIVAIVDGLVQGLFGFIPGFDSLGSAINTLTGWLGDLGDWLSETGGRAIGFIASFFVPFGKAFSVLGTVFKAILPRLSGVFSWFVKLLNPAKILQTVGHGLISVWSFVSRVFEVLYKAVKFVFGIYSKFANAVFNAWARVIQFGKALSSIIGFAGKVNEVFQKLKKPLDSVLTIIRNIINAAQSAWGWLQDILGIDGEEVDVTVNVKRNDIYSGPKPGEPGFIGPVALSQEELDALKNANVDTDTTSVNTATNKLKERVKKFIDAFKAATQKVIDAAKNMREAMQAMANDFRDTIGAAFGTIERGATFAFRPEMIIRKLKRVVEASKNFAADLQRIKDAGGDQGLIDELIGMGAEQGGIAAAGLAGNLPALQQITALRSQVGAVGKSAFQLSQERLDSEAELIAAIKALKKVVVDNTVRAKTNININARMSAAEIVAEIKRYERLNGRVFSN